MSALYLSRAQRKRTPQIEALAELLLPNDKGERAHASHRLVWSLFAREGDAETPAKPVNRTFLFREIGPSRPGRETGFMILSNRPPNPDNPVLDVETQSFAPALRAGDRLRFSLRVNATITPKGQKGRSDLVMHALRGIPKAERHLHRERILQSEGRRWLEAQGRLYGFRLDPAEEGADEAEEEGGTLRIDGYDLWQFPRLGPTGRIAVFDCEGELEVTDPGVFLARLPQGFGRARGFGCGLMLIRRA